MNIHNNLSIEQKNSIVRVKKSGKTFIEIDATLLGGAKNFKAYSDRIVLEFKTGIKKCFSLIDGCELEIKNQRSIKK